MIRRNLKLGEANYLLSQVIQTALPSVTSKSKTRDSTQTEDPFSLGSFRRNYSITMPSPRPQFQHFNSYIDEIPHPKTSTCLPPIKNKTRKSRNICIYDTEYLRKNIKYRDDLVEKINMKSRRNTLNKQNTHNLQLRRKFDKYSSPDKHQIRQEIGIQESNYLQYKGTKKWDVFFRLPNIKNINKKRRERTECDETYIPLRRGNITLSPPNIQIKEVPVPVKSGVIINTSKSRLNKDNLLKIEDIAEKLDFKRIESLRNEVCVYLRRVVRAKFEHNKTTVEQNKNNSFLRQQSLQEDDEDDEDHEMRKTPDFNICQ